MYVFIDAVPGFVGVEHRLGGQRRLEFLVRLPDGGARRFPGLLCASRTDRDLQRAFEQGFTDDIAPVQAVLAMATRLRNQILDCIRALDRHQRARMSGMPGLPAHLARGPPASPSEDGDFEVVLEFC